MGIDAVDVVARSFQTLVGNRAVLIYAAVGGLISALVSVAFLSQVSALSLLSGGVTLATLRTLISFIGLAFIGLLVVFLIDVFIRGSLISAANTGKNADVGKAANQAISRYISLLLTLIVVGIAVGVGFILLVIPGIYLAVKLSLAPVEAVVGKKGVVDSLGASWRATDGNFWGVLGAFILMIVAILVITGVLGFIFGIAGLAPVSSFITRFVGYVFTVMLVLIYQNVGAPAQKRTKRRG